MTINGIQALYVEESNQEEEADKQKQPDSFLRVSKETHDALKEAAEAEERSIKSTADRAIRKAFTKGLVWEKCLLTQNS